MLFCFCMCMYIFIWYVYHEVLYKFIQGVPKIRKHVLIYFLLDIWTVNLKICKIRHDFGLNWYASPASNFQGVKFLYVHMVASSNDLYSMENFLFSDKCNYKYSILHVKVGNLYNCTCHWIKNAFFFLF